MKRFSEQLKNKANTIKLTVSEKADLRARVVSYMEYHPLPASKRVKAVLNSGELSELKVLPLNFKKLFTYGTASVCALVLSISYVAEQAVPGDSLYAVKVRVNEEVRSTLAIGSYQKVVWETERLNRRLAEARLLASEGRLTEAVEADVASAVREHSENALREIEVLKQTDKEEAALASIQLSTAIDVQESSLRSDNMASTTDGTSPSLIASALAETKQHEAAAGPSEVPSFARLSAHVEQETTRAYELLQNINKIATEEEKTDIERRLEDIERSVNEAMGQSEGEDMVAREKMISVLERTQKLIVYMTNIDVRTALTVEEIVPITLTYEERRQAIEESAKSIVVMLDQADAALAATTSLALFEKLTPAASNTRSEANSILEALMRPEADIDGLEIRMTEIKAMAADIATLLNLDETPTAPITETIPEAVDTKIPEAFDGSTTTATTTATSTDAESEIDIEVDVETGLEAGIELPLGV